MTDKLDEFRNQVQEGLKGLGAENFPKQQRAVSELIKIAHALLLKVSAEDARWLAACALAGYAWLHNKNMVEVLNEQLEQVAIWKARLYQTNPLPLVPKPDKK